MTPLTKQRTQLVLIALIFVAPVLSAWVAWKYIDGGQGATTNAGTLVRPAQPVNWPKMAEVAGPEDPKAIAKGRWTYVHLLDGACGEECKHWLYLTRQIRAGLSKDQYRTRRLLLLARPATPEFVAWLGKEHPNLFVRRLDEAGWSGVKALFKAGDNDTMGTHVFLMDPLNNLMMRYTPAVPVKGMIKDMRKLLKASQIG